MNCAKKRVLSLLMLLAMMVSLVACGGDSSAAGTYHLTEMNVNGVSVDLKELSGQSGVEIKIDLVLEEDGNFSLDMGALGVSQSMSGTWKADGNTLTLTSDGEDVPATLDGTKITLEEDGQMLIFQKE